jgi:hypothetical protein
VVTAAYCCSRAATAALLLLWSVFLIAVVTAVAAVAVLPLMIAPMVVVAYGDVAVMCIAASSVIEDMAAVVEHNIACVVVSRIHYHYSHSPSAVWLITHRYQWLRQHCQHCRSEQICCSEIRLCIP